MNKILLFTIRGVGVVSMSLACTLPALAQSSTGSSDSGTSAGSRLFLAWFEQVVQVPITELAAQSLSLG